MMQNHQFISADYPFQSRFITVKGSNLHYIEEGEGKPILFLHGMPSSSYMWRNIIPHLRGYGRCIALDLIGHGTSDSPDIEFRIKDHLAYLTEFIELLDLKDILIVGHSWGASLGIAYAREHEHNIRGLSYLEPMLGSWKNWEDFNPNNPAAQDLFKKLRSSEGWDLIVNQNMFLEHIFVNASMRELSPEEKAHYISPFLAIERRKAAWRAPQELPIEHNPADVVTLVDTNFSWMKKTTIPQLFFYTDPAAFFTKEAVEHFVQQACAVTPCYLGKGVYNHAEDYPHEIGFTLAAWIINTYSLGSVTPKFSFYTTIHKAIRKSLFDTAVLAGQTDFFDREKRTTFVEKFSDLTSLLKNHSLHEDTYIHPLLIEKNIGASIETDHERLEEELQRLEQMLRITCDSQEQSICYDLGTSFYLAFNEFISHYLQHLLDEETQIMPALREAYPLSILLSAMDKFKKSQSEDEMRQSLSLLLGAINIKEEQLMINNIKQAASQKLN
ncbi:haloalkane dehalogenase [Legionella bononiensis]|uniref:Haloalkane dehalogenase n=1 Tax=Legionella bononiensis TaxID=2793102 RepID=A0ABS1W6M7_9GAMM|nr:haloalkane dehalogenase [Legionella bononiensis]MBL7478422.1 haloalkane dehalogenase [Legionella bononiensis]MBL7525019.1 haloalkane dehalogenase [Legionella bononiensis]MBL7561316.1 haloalkane dehalogenase [Legionella bononiensis]